MQDGAVERVSRTEDSSLFILTVLAVLLASTGHSSLCTRVTGECVVALFALAIAATPIAFV